MTEPESFRIERDGNTLFVGRNSTGVAALLLAEAAHGEDLRGAQLHCANLSPVLVRTAKLIGISDIHCSEASAGLAYTFGDQTKVTSKANSLEALSQGSNSDEEFLRELRKRLLNVVDNNLVPTDEALCMPIAPRMSGGGGT